MSEIMKLVLLAALFLGLFIAAELLYRFARLHAEVTRKIVHISTGLLTLTFPLLLNDVWEVALLCGSFFVVLLLSMRFHFLPSIHAIDRPSSGSILYPVIVCCVFLFYKRMSAQPALFGPLYYFYTPILTMAICDPVAAFAGVQFRKSHPQLPEGKTWAGSIAFFVSAFVIISWLGVVFSTHRISVLAILMVGAGLSFAAMIAERVSKKGWDNFSIPAVVAIGLWLVEKMCSR